MKSIHNLWDIMKCHNWGVKQISEKHRFGLTFTVQIKMWEMWKENIILTKSVQNNVLLTLEHLPLLCSACSRQAWPTEESDLRASGHYISETGSKTTKRRAWSSLVEFLKLILIYCLLKKPLTHNIESCRINHHVPIT